MGQQCDISASFAAKVYTTHRGISTTSAFIILLVLYLSYLKYMEKEPFSDREDVAMVRSVYGSWWHLFGFMVMLAHIAYTDDKPRPLVHTVQKQKQTAYFQVEST